MAALQSRMFIAAVTGDLRELEQLRGAGYEWVDGVCSGAAMGGHLELLKWAREHGCPWGSSVCSSAARAGKLTVLQWAVESGCPFRVFCPTGETHV